MDKKIIKHETLISIILIITYILFNSYCVNNFGINDFRTIIINLLLSISIIVFIIINKLGNYYGLTSFPNNKKFLYFIPLILLISVNLWNGININNTKTEIILYIISMLLVGFLEEIIFRGFLFKLLEKDNVNKAIIITSITFGIGHIVNLLNGADIISTLIQICYSISIGYLFAIIFHKGKSLWPCIITHSLTNSLSIFNIDNTISLYIAPISLIIIPILYALYINKNIN